MCLFLKKKTQKINWKSENTTWVHLLQCVLQHTKKKKIKNKKIKTQSKTKRNWSWNWWRWRLWVALATFDFINKWIVYMVIIVCVWRGYINNKVNNRASFFCLFCLCPYFKQCFYFFVFIKKKKKKKKILLNFLRFHFLQKWFSQTLCILCFFILLSFIAPNTKYN